jgi:integrase
VPKLAVKSTARIWKQAPSPRQKYRDRKRVQLPDGTRKEVFGYGPTRQAATRDLYSKIERLTAQHSSSSSITMTQLVARLLRHKRTVKGRKRKTIYNDADLFNRHIRPHIGSTPIVDVTLEDLQAIQYRLVAAKKYRTAELATILLKSMYKFALRTYRKDIRAGRIRLFNLAEDLDTIKRPDSARRKPARPWTAEELGRFLAAAKARYDKSLKNLLYPAFHAAVSAGLRRGEILGLKRSDLKFREVEIDGRQRRQYYLDISEQFVYYDGRHHRDTPKSESGTREMPVDLPLARALRRHIHKLNRVAKRNPDWKSNQLMFPSFNGLPLEPRNLYRARDQLIDELDLPLVTLHDLRGLYGTYVTRELVRAGKYSPKLVMRLLGHSHPDVALKYYTQVIEDDYRGATFEPPLPGTAGNSAGRKPKKKDAETVESTS